MELPDNYRFPGPVIANRVADIPFDWEILKSRSTPKILISIGTTFDHQFKKDFFSKVIEAFGEEEIFVIVVSDETLFESWPSNFLVQQRVPQLELLPHLDGVVCHAGHNTVSEALSNGLPLVVIPIAYDQSHVAGRVVSNGCGVRLNFNRFKAPHLKNAVNDILNDQGYRLAAQRIQSSFKEAGGTKTAAAWLDQIPVKVFQNG
jgi:MGT family glycosyltransferase